MRYLLDTNILSEPLKESTDPKVMEKLRQHEGDMVTASVVWHELIYGMERVRRSKKRTLIETYLNNVVAPHIPILPYDEKAAALHGDLRASLSLKGINPPFADGQIAAIALINSLTLVTGNHRDFTPYKGLRVENWFERKEK